MKKKLSFGLALTLCLSLAACGGETTPTTQATAPASPDAVPTAQTVDSDLATIKENGKMVIGYTVYEPMNYTDSTGTFTGFDTELATAVCEKLGVTPDFVIINWDTKEVALAAKDIDCIWNGLTLTPEREENMACTIPYVKNAQVVVVREDFAYTDTNSLEGKTVCAEIGSAGEEQIKGGEGVADPGLAKADYVGKNVQTDCLMEVKAGTADAAVLDMTLANSMIGAGTNYEDLKIVDYLAQENYGVAFRKGSDARDAVNDIFQTMVTDGYMKTLADKYGLELAD